MAFSYREYLEKIHSTNSASNIGYDELLVERDLSRILEAVTTWGKDLKRAEILARLNISL